jgi:hypothetical protein
MSGDSYGTRNRLTAAPSVDVKTQRSACVIRLLLSYLQEEECIVIIYMNVVTHVI